MQTSDNEQIKYIITTKYYDKNKIDEDISKCLVSDDFLYKKMMIKLIDESPVEDLKRIFDCTKEECTKYGEPSYRYEIKLELPTIK